MKKTITLLVPFTLFAGSFEDLEKDLFDPPESQGTLKDITYTPSRSQDMAQPSYVSESSSTAILSQNRTKRWAIEGEFLYMKPYFSNVPYLLINNLSQFNPTSPQIAHSKVKSQILEGDYGFKINSSFQTNWVDTLITASWTRFHTQSSQTAYTITDFGPAGNGYNAAKAINYIWNSSLTEPQLVSGTPAIAALESFTGQATGTAKLNMDLIDGMMQFPYETKKRLTIAPSIGVQGFLFEYTAHINRVKTYSGSSPSTTGPFNQNLVYLKQKFNAIGPALAVDGSFNLGSKWESLWTFDVLAQAAAIFGQLKTYNNTLEMNPSPAYRLQLSSKNNLFKALINFRAGFAWERESNKIGFMIKAGYDLHFMPNLMQLINGQTNIVGRSDFSTQGVYVGLGLKF